MAHVFHDFWWLTQCEPPRDIKPYIIHAPTTTTFMSTQAISSCAYLGQLWMNVLLFLAFQEQDNTKAQTKSSIYPSSTQQ